jgi:CRISPR-associated protein Csm3
MRNAENAPGATGEECRNILKIFGSVAVTLRPLRIRHRAYPVSFADAPLNETWKKTALENRWGYFEVKSKTPIDRIRGVAKNPRFTERVVAGAEFDFSVSLTLLGDNEQPLFDYLLLGLKLLEMDALGGSGSRGYGRITLVFEDEDVAERFKTIQPF